MVLSTDERRSLAIIAGLLVVASAARWLERPQPLLEDVPSLDIAELEESSRAAKSGAAPGSSATSTRGTSTRGTSTRATSTRATSNRASSAHPPNTRQSTPARSSAFPPTSTPRSAAKPAAAGPKAKIDPNTATAEELAVLTGIGPSLAARIVEERSRGPFTSVQDLTRVRGIGATLANTLAGEVSLPAGAVRSNARPATGLTPVGNIPAAMSGTARKEPPDINQISSTDLQKVRGVGPVLAGRLIARRDSLRRFTSWEQVDEVAGVGPAMLSRLKESLVLR